MSGALYLILVIFFTSGIDIKVLYKRYFIDKMLEGRNHVVETSNVQSEKEAGSKLL